MPMASTTPSAAHNPLNAISEDGVYFIKDPILGEQVDQMEAKKFPFKTEEGLDFCKLNTLDDKRIRNILESAFPWSGLGFYKVFGRDPSRAFSFWNSTSRVLVVQLWSSGSRVVYYGGSHHQLLNATPATNGNGLLEIPPDCLNQGGIKPIEVDMESGGLAIVDGRLGFKILKGFAITFGFTSRDELKGWARMELPNMPNLKRKVAEMETTTIGMNFKFL